MAAELAGPGDVVMRTLEGHLDCEVFLRGNVLTLGGDEEAVAMGRTVVRELTDLVRPGHEIAPGTVEAIAGALDTARVAEPHPGGRRLAPPVAQGGSENGQPEALCRRDP